MRIIGLWGAYGIGGKCFTTQEYEVRNKRDARRCRLVRRGMGEMQVGVDW